MSLTSILYTLLLKPLQILFEFVYDVSFRCIDNKGFSIVALSLAINLLVLPLYNRADAMQEEERQTEAKLNKWVTHIKKTFKGDERTMMLQTYYRQNNYSPVYVLRSAASLFLEIPFFIAAYNFLSKLEHLKGVPFGPIADLSKQDGLIVLFGISINLLPILMTLINVISSAIFTKGYPLKTKIQLYGMAAFFLVFLYNSPSGLVFYWTLNNLFSLIKTIVLKSKNPKKSFYALLSLIGVGFLTVAIRMLMRKRLKMPIALIIVGLFLFVPFILTLLKKNGKSNNNNKKSKLHIPEIKSDKKVFILGACFLSVLTGTLIPSSVINASPQEFIDIKYFLHPNWYILNSILIAVGLYVIWFGVFYWLSSPKIRAFFDLGIWVCCGVAVVNYLFFGKRLGTMSADLIFDRYKWIFFPIGEILLNALVIIALFVLLSKIFIKFKKYVSRIIAIAIATCICMSAINCVAINKSISKINTKDISDIPPEIALSKTGKNVMVVMLDRALGEYVPYIFNERPELYEQFSGFTYYSNTLSFGGYTNFATPPLFGGYEYTPIEMNRRKKDSIEKKHNEALKLMPKLFSDAGYNVTVFDPPYAGYEWTPNLSIYNDIKNVNKFITKGYFATEKSKRVVISNRKRNFFCYGFMKTFPLPMQNLFYARGSYHNMSQRFSGQSVINQSVAEGINNSFYDSFSTLQHLPDITAVTDDDKATFLLMDNEATHEDCLLSEPDYTISKKVDNTKYDNEHKDRFTVNGKTLDMSTALQYRHYETNAAVLIELGKWFNYLKEQGVYDNTKIIVVSDHARGLNHIKEMQFEELRSNVGNLEFYCPLLMVKDFGATGFNTSEEFMTNADVPTLAFKDIIDNPVNPYTGKKINSKEKTAHDQYVIVSNLYNISVNGGNQFKPSHWYSVHDSVWERSNWKKVAEDTVLTGYKK